MSTLVRFFINRPMLINIIILAVIGLGVKSVMEARKEGFPEISMNKIIIQTIYPGASARDVELNVTVPIEDALEELEGIKEVLSVSEEGMSRIEVQADDNGTPDDFKKLYNDVESAIAAIGDLPREIEGRPSISEYTSSDVPVMEVAFTGDYATLKPYIDRLEKKIRKVSGVSNVTVTGLPDEEAHILVDPNRAREYRVDLKMIQQAIQKRNLEGSGGTIKSFVDEKKIVFLSKFDNYKDVLETNLIMNDTGYGVKLRQVATVHLAPKENNLIVRNNGKRGATLSIKKTGTSDLIRTVDGIHRLLESESLPAGTTMKVLLDQSRLTRDRISLLAGNAVIGFILVIAVLFMIFDAKTAVWTAFGIPFTLFGMFIFINNYGISLNLISLGGFIIIIGMLVDDAIVIAEEINNNRELGMEPKEAAVTAVKTMWVPVAASSLTTMVAFTPLFSLGGFPGKFIWAIPLMVIVGLSISLFESYFLLPAHLSHGKAAKIVKKRFVTRMENAYHSALDFAMRHRYPVIASMAVILVASMTLFARFVDKDPFPQDAAEGFTVSVTLPKGTTAEETEKAVYEFEKLMLKLPENELIGFSTRIGTHSLLSATTMGTQNNIAVIFAYLKPFSQRSRTAEQIMDSLKNEIAKKEDKKAAYVTSLSRLGPPMGRPFEIRVISNNDDLRNKKEKEIRKYLATLTGVYDIENDDIEGKNELNLKLDHDILTRTGLTVEDVLTTLRIAFDGMVVSNLSTVDSTLDFRLRLNSKGRASKQFIDTLPIANKQGNIINLSMFTSLEEQPSRAGIHHVNGERAVTVFGNTDLKKITPVEVMNRVRSRFPSDNTVSVEYSGQPVETNLIFSGLAAASLAAFVGIYLLISLILNSFSKPMIIMTSIPFLVIGFAFVLITHGIPASMMGGIAMVGLMGVIVNNAIVMVHTIRSLAGDNPVTEDHIRQGSVSRLRPVLLTTITTVLGVLPTGYGIGGSDPFLSHMSLVMAYGLLFGTAVTLFMIPLLFAAGNDITRYAHALVRFLPEKT
ncbi:MAG TPA: efflux RND transporter permease subunit [Spirochaetota bacterium]|nr:efflux RND transporter permease subunit [Spirochaetota bacterium]HNT13111.1 efflux RND transporter permease subunit [Spirochaetota bacterium]